MTDTDGLTAFLEQQRADHLAMLKEMVDINTYSRNPEGVNQVAGYTVEKLKALGFESELVPSKFPYYGNHLYAVRRGKSPRAIVLVSHTDTVFPAAEEEANNFHWREDGDRIYGPGVVDVKGGTMLIFLTLAGIRHAAPEVYDDITWIVHINGAEEELNNVSGHGILSRISTDKIFTDQVAVKSGCRDLVEMVQFNGIHIHESSPARVGL